MRLFKFLGDIFEGVTREALDIAESTVKQAWNDGTDVAMNSLVGTVAVPVEGVVNGAVEASVGWMDTSSDDAVEEAANDSNDWNAESANDSDDWNAGASDDSSSGWGADSSDDDSGGWGSDGGDEE